MRKGLGSPLSVSIAMKSFCKWGEAQGSGLSEMWGWEGMGGVAQVEDLTAPEVYAKLLMAVHL